MKKNIPKYFLSISFIILLSIQNAYASKGFPPPKGSGGFDDDYVVGGPIDDILPYLMAVAIIYGLFSVIKIINKNNKIIE